MLGQSWDEASEALIVEHPMRESIFTWGRRRGGDEEEAETAGDAPEPNMDDPDVDSG